MRTWSRSFVFILIFEPISPLKGYCLSGCKCNLFLFISSWSALDQNWKSHLRLHSINFLSVKNLLNFTFMFLSSLLPSLKSGNTEQNIHLHLFSNKPNYVDHPSKHLTKALPILLASCLCLIVPNPFCFQQTVWNGE